MSHETATGPEPTSARLELLRVGLLVGIFAAQLYVASRIANAPADYCFTRPFWLDEFHTLALVKEGRADQLLLKLARGGDFNPPGLHLPLWMLARVTNCSDEVLLRAFSCGVGVGGLIVTYFLLRIRFPWRVSMTAVLGMWSSSPQLVQQMFEGRTYSFWFFAIALLCLLLSLRSTSRWQTVGVGSVAALMCAIHYFGIIVLGLIAACQLCGNFRDVRQRWLVGTALAAGAITLLASLPLYFSQRAAVPVSTWISPPTFGGSRAFIEGFILNYPLALPVLAYALQALWGGRAECGPSTNESNLAIYAGTCGLILWPVVLTIFSYLIQPAQLARYAVPTALAYAPLIALICRRLDGFLLDCVALLFFAIGLGGAQVVYEIRPDYREAASLVSESKVDRPLVVHWRVVGYPLFRYTGADPKTIRVSFLFRGAELSRFDEWEQAMARRMAELFPLPRTLELDELATRDEFHLLAVPGEEQRYEGWKPEPLKTAVGPLRGFRMTRTPDAQPRRKSRGADDAPPRR